MKDENEHMNKITIVILEKQNGMQNEKRSEPKKNWGVN